MDMYQKALENAKRSLDAPAPKESRQASRGLVAPKQLEAPQYDPMEFIRSGMQRIVEITRSGKHRPLPEMPQKKVEEKEPTLSRKKFPDMIEETTEEGINVTTNAAHYGLVRRPRTKSGGGFLGLIDQHEGGGDYRALLGFSNRNHFSDVDITNMTLRELDEFSRTRYAQWSRDWKAQNNHGNPNTPSTPMGRYQFVNTTLQAQARRLGLDPDTTKFTPEVQDRLFESYLSSRLARADSMEGKVRQLRNAWEGFKRVPTPRLEAAIREFEGAKS